MKNDMASDIWDVETTDHADFDKITYDYNPSLEDCLIRLVRDLVITFVVMSPIIYHYFNL